MKLINQWNANTGVNIIDQIKKWNALDSAVDENNSPTPYSFKRK
jgi:hypothetical protein